MRRLILLTACYFTGMQAFANITLPDIFSDHMVLQQQSEVTIWGWAKPFEMVSITASWAPDETNEVRVNSSSAWSIQISTPAAGGPYHLTIQGYNTIEIKDVMIGEVWLGSGQSNMEWTPSSGIDNAEVEIAAADFPEIRFFTVQTITADNPQQLVQGEWVRCTPETMSRFSAVLYFFGRELKQKMNVPVGLINASWGGTPIEIWTPEASVTGDRMLDEYADLLEPVPWGPVERGVAYNAMIHPLIPFRIRGTLWYQGEANVGYPDRYGRALKTMAESWRAAWGNDFSFYYAQIAPFRGYGDDNVRGAVLRDQQRKALDLIGGSGMVVLSDIGNLDDIHPRNKQDVGKRLAGWALHHDYGFSEIACSGPLFHSFEPERDRLLIRFDHDEGLTARGAKLTGFEVQDPSGEWLEAEAAIEGNRVAVTLPAAEITGLRFAYRNASEPNLFNSAGLPASCFEVLFK